MIVTLDLFTRKHKLYYVGLLITVITFSMIAIAGFYNKQSKSSFDPLYDILLIICCLISVAFCIITSTGLLGTYLKDGELVLADNYLIIDTVRIPLNQIKYINLKMSPRHIKAIVLDKNIIIMGDKNANEYKRRFAVKSQSQNRELEKISDAWRALGIPLYVSYKGI